MELFQYLNGFHPFPNILLIYIFSSSACFGSMWLPRHCPLRNLGAEMRGRRRIVLLCHHYKSSCFHLQEKAEKNAGLLHWRSYPVSYTFFAVLKKCVHVIYNQDMEESLYFFHLLMQQTLLYCFMWKCSL